MTCDEMLASFRKHASGRRFARNRRGDAIAVWTGERWSACAVLGLGGIAEAQAWYRVSGECDGVQANGVPLFPQEGWIE